WYRARVTSDNAYT
ncbi:flagellar biosynthesis protein FlhA, partial [Vibrio harveyi]